MYINRINEKNTINLNVPEIRLLSASATRRIGLTAHLLKLPLVERSLLMVPGTTYLMDVKGTIAKTLNFDYGPVNPIIDKALAEVDKMIREQVIIKAGEVIKKFHAEQQAALPLSSIKEFYDLGPTGNFNPHQYFVATFGATWTMMDYYREKGKQEIAPAMQAKIFDHIRDGYLLLKAAEYFL